jgi:protein SCO1
MASWCWIARSSKSLPGIPNRDSNGAEFRLSAGDHASPTRRRYIQLGIVIASCVVLLDACATKPPLPTYGAVPEFQLTDQTGAPFSSSAALKGRVWVADFIFTNCPGPCPMMSSKMNQVQKALSGNDARLVSFTIDPARDTPPVLAEYANHFEAQPGRWYFLTGPVAALNALAKDAFHLNEIDGKNLEHSVRLALVDRSSQIRGFYLSTDKDAIPALIADARRLLEERP